jgi:hypothetical protein
MAFFVSFHGTSNMVKVQVREQHIGNVLARKSSFMKFTIQRSVSMEVVVTEEFFRLLVSNAGIHKQQSVALFDEHRSHGPSAKIVFISRDMLLPKCLWHHAKHGASIEFEVSGVNRVYVHGMRTACLMVRISRKTHAD